MTRLLARLRNNLLALLFAVAWVAVLAVLVLAQSVPGRTPALRAVAVSLLAAALVTLLFVAWRVFRFRRRAYVLLRRLVAGDYDTGLPAAVRWRDEVSVLAGLCNKLAEQLRQYDALRARRIRQLRMTLDLVLEHTEQPMILFDVARDALEFNAAMSGILETPRQTVQLSALRNLGANGPFVEMLRRAVASEKSAQEGRVAIQFPGRDVVQETNVRVVPFKDKDDSVPLAIVFGKPV